MSVRGKSVVATGGAGFIGSHLVDRLIADEPTRIVVVDSFFLATEARRHGVSPLSLPCLSTLERHHYRRGGMLVTDRDDLGARARLLCSHGAGAGEIRPRLVAPGFNCRLSDVIAAIGVAQMPKLAWIIERRRELASLYGSRLAGVEGITPQAVRVDCETTFQSYVVLLDDHYERDADIRSLRSRDVECTLGTYSLHMQPAYEELLRCRPGDLPNGRRAYESSLTLQLFPSMREADVDLVIGELTDVLKACPSG